MESRLDTLNRCADVLEHEVAGDNEIRCLVGATHAALELCADLLEAHEVPPARGYKDACDKVAAAGLVSWDLAERLKRIFDVSDRAPTAWSTLAPGDLEWVREHAPASLRELVTIATRELHLDDDEPLPAAPT